MNRENIAKRIAHLRKKQGLSQTALAETLSVSTQAVSKWECAQSLPDIEMLLSMSELFGVSIHSILDDHFALPRPLAALPKAIDASCLTGAQIRVLRSVSRYFTEQELSILAKQVDQSPLSVRVGVVAGGETHVNLSADDLTDGMLEGLSAAMADALEPTLVSFDQGIRLLISQMICPICGAPLSMDLMGTKAYLSCGIHPHEIVEGVPDFGACEIPGEYWSLFLKNFDQYCEMRDPRNINPNNMRGLDFQELLWREIEQQKPRTILDIASGAGSCIEMFAGRITWPCVVVFSDISHRILKYDRMWFSKRMANPNVRYAFVACDCARMPFADGAFDAVTSLAGFESMQDKFMDGFREAFRVLKSGGKALYSINTVTGDSNSERWKELVAGRG